MSEPGNGGVQGEGDYEAARRYRERTERFVASQDDPAPRPDVAPGEEAELEAAEDAARGRARLGEHNRADADQWRRTPSADDGRAGGDEGEGAADMDAEIARRESGSGPGLRATEFDIARLPPD